MQAIQQEPVAIIGIGCRFPGADNPREFWKLLRTGKSAIREVPADRWDSQRLFDEDSTQPGKIASRWGGFLDQVDQFDPQAFPLLPGEALSLDPQQRLLLEVAWEAFEDAGLLFSEVAGSNTSVSIGVGWGDYLRLLTRNWSRIDRYALTGNATSVVANRLSYTFDLRGPSVSLDVGCSSSLMAVYLACQSLWTGESDLALAGGVHLLLSPDGSLIISKAGFLSSDGVCRALDAQANGTVMGEGAGVVLLKRLSQVQPSDRVYAVICGVEANHNGQTDKIIAPSQAAQVELLRKTYRNAKIDPAELDYIELHGMGFLRGDAVEANALGEVLSGEGRRTHACLVGSVKTNIGDLESAAGIASLIKVALALYHREIPPSLHFTQRNPDISLRDWQLAVPLTCEPWPEKENLPLAGVTTLALAGANVHAVVSAPSSRVSLESKAGEGWNETELLLPLSAHTPEALRAYISSWKDFLAEESISPAHWQRICSTASLHRMHRRYRFALVSRTPEQAIHLLDAFLQETELQRASQEEQPSHLSFLFPHEGILPEEIDGELLRRERVLQTTLRACNRFLREQRGITFLAETSQAPLAFSSEPSTKRLAAFALQLALVDLWRAWGIVPTGVTGSGWGEVAAAYAAGALSLEAALSLVTPAVEEGGALGEGTLRCAMYSLHAGFLPAGSSLPEDHWEVWRGREPETRDLWQKSEWIDQLNAEIVLTLGATSASTEALAARGGQQNAQVTLLLTLQGARSLRESMLQALGTLYVLGYTINWSALYEPSSPVNQCVSLPPFPWQRERCWPNWLTVEEISAPPEMRDGLSAVSQAPALTFAEQLSTHSLEEALVELWAEILGVEQLDAQANFFELGGHSLLATQLITHIRTACQLDLPLNALLSAPTPAACAEFILRQKEAGEHAEQLSPAFPEVQSNLEQRYLPFPTTEVQQAYWLGRDVPFESIRVGNHGYIEVAARDLDVPRFNQAIQRLVDRHEMLRAVMLPDGQQQILQSVPPFEATIIDLRGESAQEAATRLQEIRQEMDHQILPVDRWPSFDIRILLLDERNAQIHLSVEVLFVDAWSTHLLIQEFLQFYRSPEIQLPALELSFRDYVLAEAELLTTEFYRRSEEYWKQRLADLPPAPELPLAQYVDPELPRRFVHRERRLNKERWSRLKARAAQVGLTPSGLLLAAFAEAIGAWCKNPRFTINLSVFHRLPLHAQVNEIVGDFTSLIMLAIDHSAPETFEQRASRIQRQLWSDLDHSFYNGVSVLRDLARMHGNLTQTFMPIVFTSLLIQDVANAFPAPWQETLYCVSQSPQVLLDHQVLESGGELVLHWQSVDVLFPPGLFDDMFAAYYQLLTLLAEDEVAWHDVYLPVLPDAYRALYAEVDATEAPLTDDLLHTLFSEQAALQPQQQAVVSPQRTLTYEEVARYTAALAPRLRQLGAQPNRLVGVVMEKGWEQVVAVLSILQAGAAYLPIDPALPDERLLYLLEHGEVEIVLTQSWLDQRIPWPADLRRLCVDTECPPGAYLDTPLPRVEPIQCPSDLAYVIYTSGSTGLPKGVMIDHRGAVNTILDMNQRFQVTSADRVLALSALNFDLSVYDIFGTLAAGGTIVYPTENSERDPRAWLELLIEQRVTIWNSVPALLQMFVEYIEDHKLKLEGACLRLALLSGDWIPLTLPESLWKLLPQVEIMSLGGATEASIWSIVYPITSINPSWKSIPYGKAMKNQRVAVLNERFVPRPPWVPGSLYIGGVGVALGYWRDEEKTSRSFLRHPVTGERLYRTGDLGRYLPDGNIEFLGREDFQVKIRGYRIELGEIEAALLQHEAVQAAVVTTYNETGQASNQRLVGYIVPTQEIIAASNGAISAQSPDAFQEYFAGATIHDAIKRTQFKLRQPSLRHEEARRYVQLARPRYTDELLKSYMERRSHRQFDSTPLSLRQLSDFLSCLYQIEVDGLFKYRYASTGGLYAVQTYLYVKPGRIEDLAAGTYYYHPREHRLILLTPDAPIDESVHALYNRQIFQHSAFSLFLVAHLDAIEPLYGKAARDYCLLDAGYMSHQLMLALDTHQIGTCPVGGLDFARIRQFFALQANDVLVHSLLCGKALPVEAQAQGLAQEGFYSTSSGRGESNALLIEELTAFLQTKLPEYMVPSSFVLLEKLPLTANGKVDRRSLPKPEWQPSVAEAHTFVAPATPLEQHLARIWCEILKLERVGLHDNFFRLGGHSLLATRIMLKIRDEFHVELPLRALFNAPTLAELAQAVEKALQQGTSREILPALPQIVPVPDQRYQPFPLTDLQQAYLLGRTDLFALGNVSTHLYLEFESEQLDLERFTLAWQKLIQRHDMLRVVILSNDQQQVLEHVPPYQIETLDLRGRDPQYIQAELELIRQRLSHQVIQADRWPLFEICAARLDERRTRLFISIDALAYDYGSWRILYRELGVLYKNPDAQLVPLELTFRDYILAEAALEETELYKRSRDYWWKRLPDLYPAPELPLVQNAVTLARPQFVRREARLGREDWRRLKTLSTQAGITPSVVLLTALAEVMAAWSKKPRFTINVPRMQRLPLHPQVNDVVGIFSSFILLEVDCSRNETFQQRARRIQAQLWDDINHQYINGISIIRGLIRLRGGFSGPLMPVVFTSTLVWDKTLESDATEQPGMLESILREIHSISQTPQVWIDQQVFERGGELFFNWDSIDELFPEGLLDDMFGAYCNLLRHLLKGHTWLEEVPCLTPASQLALREQINDNVAPIPDDLLHELFAKQAAARPEHPAIITPEIVLTYRELAERVNRLAHWLRAAGVQSDQLVAIVMNKGWEQVVAAQAILTAGGAYVPFDPYLPRERLHALLEQSQVGIVLTQSWLETSLPWPAALKLLSVDTEDLASWPATSLPTVQHMDNLAYVIYTSGSTGSPKGVMIAHRGVVNCITQANARFAIGPDDRLLSLSNLHHDFSVYDVFGVLAAGGTLVLPERGGEKDSVHWVDLVQRYQVTLWATVPAMMEMLLEQVAVPAAQQAHPLRSLRLVWMGGDWIPISIPERLLASVPGIQVVSLGGPTETTLFNIWYPIERLDPAWKSIPYGRPLANTRYYVLNERLQQCPTWVAGELYCAGVGLARGYLGDEERTRARFIHHPQTGERLYRTGDLGRYLPDGNIEFLGRDDFQVKIRGYRIELGEIEAALAQHEGVHAAVVSTYNETQQTSNLRLVAYIVPEPRHAPTPEELRAFLKTKLPEHMLPALFINLQSLPLTSSGKIDRRALPAPQVEESTHESRAFVAPRDPVEEVVAGIWADVFGHKQIGIYDNFFDLGGHSMMATKIVARLRELFQGKFSIRTLFEKLTVAGVAEALRAHEEIPGSVEKIARLQLKINAMSAEEVTYALQLRERKGQ